MTLWRAKMQVVQALICKICVNFLAIVQPPDCGEILIHHYILEKKVKNSANQNNDIRVLMKENLQLYIYADKSAIILHN